MTPIPARIQAVRAALAAHEVDGAFITNSANRRYLSGFEGSAGMVLITPDAAELIVDGRYETAAAGQAPDLTLVGAGTRLVETAAERVDALGVERIGFEADDVTVSRLAKFEKNAPNARWTACTGLVEELRWSKSAEELAAIQRAQGVADQAMEFAYTAARPGMTERELAWRLEVVMREAGAERLAFETIVAAGENSALPHHHPSDRPIQAGEAITIDLGAVVDGYHSDMTRTFTLGPATANADTYAAVWDIVLRAYEASVSALRAGARGVAVDAAGRDLITAEGYGEQFGHGTGHGVGLEIHEGPRLSTKSPDVPIPAGTTVTIEPGIYLPGRFGVRIEDLVVVEDGGCRSLTSVPKVQGVALR